MNDETIAKLADLAVRVGANIQPDQVVSVNSEPGKEYMTRAVARAAYQAGARFVDVQWFDPYVKRERIAHARDETLDYVPPWYGQRMLALGSEHAARVAFSGPTAPGILDGLDPVRAGRDRLPAIKESVQVLAERTTNWTIVPAPNPVWAKLVHPDLPDDEALAKLWEAIVHVCRLDEPDPVAAWNARVEKLQSAAATLTERGFDALHYEGPGTDLTVGLLPGHRWIAGRLEREDGLPHLPNVPTEETFTSPDPQRADGVVSATKPLVLPDGTVVRDIRMRFENGRAVEVSASSAEETFRTIVERDAGSARLGELALVDNEGRIGKLDTVFYDTLLDENAASHIAIGVGFPFAAPAELRDRVNHSEIHIDFMIGGPELSVTGITHDGERVPVLVAEEWRI